MRRLRLNRFAGSLAALIAPLAAAQDGVFADRIVMGVEDATGSFSLDEENVGFRTAFREANDRGQINGRKLEWIGYPRDGGESVEQGMTNVRRLVETAHVFALVNMGGPIADHVAPYAEDRRVPYLFPHEGRLDSVGKRYVFTSYPRYGDEARVMLSYLPEQRGFQKLALVRAANDYGLFFRDRLERYTANGYAIAGDAVVSAREPKDLTAELRRLVDAGADGVVMALYPRQARTLMEAKAKLAWRGRMISVGPLTDEQYLDVPGGAAEGTLGYCYYPDPKHSDAPGVVDYRAAMTRYESGRELNRYSLYGYVFGRLIVEGLRRTGRDLTRERYIDAMEGIKDWDARGVMPPVSFSRQNHHAQSAGFICELKAGRFVALTDWIKP
jgi:ABC-type branched-subunit amino acid transport system substrate-binding protein